MGFHFQNDTEDHIVPDLGKSLVSFINGESSLRAQINSVRLRTL